MIEKCLIKIINQSTVITCEENNQIHHYSKL